MAPNRIFPLFMTSFKSRFVGGGRSIRCDDKDEIVEVNLGAYNWTCSNNTQYCPGLGGFKVGCQDLTTTTTPPTPATTSSSNVNKLSVGLMLLAILAFVK